MSETTEVREFKAGEAVRVLDYRGTFEDGLNVHLGKFMEWVDSSRAWVASPVGFPSSKWGRSAFVRTGEGVERFDLSRVLLFRAPSL